MRVQGTRPERLLWDRGDEAESVREQEAGNARLWGGGEGDGMSMAPTGLTWYLVGTREPALGS